MKADRFAQVLHFVEVSRLCSFSAAAKKLSLSTSSVSRSISQLESRLGVRLLQRTTRSLKITEAGHAYLQRCQVLLEQLDAADAVADEIGAQLVGRLRISVSSGLSDVKIMPALNAFMTTHPRLNLELFVGNRYVDLVEEGYDLAIRVGQPLNEGMVVRRIGENARLLVGSPAYVSQRGQPRSPSDLSAHSLLILGNAVPTPSWNFICGAKREDVTPSGPLICNHAPALRQAALAGLGLAVLPAMLVLKDLAEGTLMNVLATWALPTQPINAVFPSSRFIPTKVRALVDHLSAALAC